jgi:hypothetical protein
MNGYTTPRTASVLAVIALSTMIAGCSARETQDTTTTSTPITTTTTAVTPSTVVQAIADGEWFAFVTVDTDDSGEPTLGIDVAEVLTGEEARQAAIDAGVIGEGEDLPNDFFISNPEPTRELLHLAPDADITVISATDPGMTIDVEVEDLQALYEGTYPLDDVYGIVPGEPIAMEVTIVDGMVTAAHAFYLP